MCYRYTVPTAQALACIMRLYLLTYLNLDTVKKIILTGFQNLSGLYSNKSGFIERPGLNH
jgi:hypothetical protein